MVPQADIGLAEQVTRISQLEVQMQQMFNYLYYEINNTETVQEQQKLVVAEYGLLDVQVLLFGFVNAQWCCLSDCFVHQFFFRSLQ